MGALFKPDEDENISLTKDDGLTYQVFRLLQKVLGKPLLHFFNLCFRLGHVLSAWTSSTVVPIPKPGTDKFRPIFLISCFSKVLECILLARLIHRLQNKASPNLYGFLPQRSTHHCLVELYTRLCPTSVIAFLDLKSAFDIANKEIFFDQLVDFGVQGSPLKWIRSYLCNGTSRF